MSTSGWSKERTGAGVSKEKLPLVRHLSRHELHTHKALASYAETLQEDRRVLLHRYRFFRISLSKPSVSAALARIARLHS